MTFSIVAHTRRANISQPAISTAISHIERELMRDAKQLLKQAEGLYSAAAIAHREVLRLMRHYAAQLAPLIVVLQAAGIGL